MKTLNFKTVKTGNLPTDCVVRRTFTRESSEQITVQFAQRIAVPSSSSSNSLVAKAQGIEQAGTNMVTALMSFSKAGFKSMFGEEVDFDTNFINTEAPLASDLFKEEVNIEVTESTSINPYNDNQQAKLNPSTMEEVLFKGEPVYRHTELIGGDAIHSFVEDTTRDYSRGIESQLAKEEVKEVQKEEMGIE